MDCLARMNTVVSALVTDLVDVDINHGNLLQI